MTHISRYDRARARLLASWQNRALGFKAIAFGLVGVVNTAVDYGVFLLARAGLNELVGCTGSASIRCLHFCHCGSAATLLLIAANTISWIVAVTGSYVMNSSITFAAESGRKLKWSAYFAFVLSGVAGWLANTATLLVAAESPAVAGLARQGARCAGKLCGELLAVAFRGVPGAAKPRVRRKTTFELKRRACALFARREMRALRWRVRRWRRLRRRHRCRLGRRRQAAGPPTAGSAASAAVRPAAPR